ncbi:MAG TPA: hypothetical protein VKF41_00705 [Bryobacteraceae bacterium]|nr:hypothetical protein [Bryobacteraceae bacterium]
MTTGEPLGKHDREVNAIRSLLKKGMHLMLETRKDFRTLAAMQKQTDASLKALLDSLRHGGNGHSKQPPKAS